MLRRGRTRATGQVPAPGTVGDAGAAEPPAGNPDRQRPRSWRVPATGRRARPATTRRRPGRPRETALRPDAPEGHAPARPRPPTRSNRCSRRRGRTRRRLPRSWDSTTRVTRHSATTDRAGRCHDPRTTGPSRSDPVAPAGRLPGATSHRPPSGAATAISTQPPRAAGRRGAPVLPGTPDRPGLQHRRRAAPRRLRRRTRRQPCAGPGHPDIPRLDLRELRNPQSSAPATVHRLRHHPRLTSTSRVHAHEHRARTAARPRPCPDPPGRTVPGLPRRRHRRRGRPLPATPQTHRPAGPDLGAGRGGRRRTPAAPRGHARATTTHDSSVLTQQHPGPADTRHRRPTSLRPSGREQAISLGKRPAVLRGAESGRAGLPRPRRAPRPRTRSQRVVAAPLVVEVLVVSAPS